NTFKEYDDLSDDNMVLNSKDTARIFEKYFGQHSFGYENLQEYLDDSQGLEEDLAADLASLDSSAVMDVIVFEDGDQHVKYREGKV
ncbi:MAG: hypothetical protein ABEJ72_07715, partial [Candidatus Aenigmatarchaeota archaeon]